MFSSEMKTLKIEVIVEKNKAGCYLGSVPVFPGCHTKTETLDELVVRLKDIIEAYLKVGGYETKEGIELIGLKFGEVAAMP